MRIFMIFSNKLKPAKIILIEQNQTKITKHRFWEKKEKGKKFREKRRPKQMRDVDKNAKMCPRTRGTERQTNTVRFVVQMTIGARHRFGCYLFTQYKYSQIHTRTHNEAEKKVLGKLLVHDCCCCCCYCCESNSEVQIECWSSSIKRMLRCFAYYRVMYCIMLFGLYVGTETFPLAHFNHSDHQWWRRRNGW